MYNNWIGLSQQVLVLQLVGKRLIYFIFFKYLNIELMQSVCILHQLYVLAYLWIALRYRNESR